MTTLLASTYKSLGTLEDGRKIAAVIFKKLSIQFHIGYY